MSVHDGQPRFEVWKDKRRVRRILRINDEIAKLTRERNQLAAKSAQYRRVVKAARADG